MSREYMNSSMLLDSSELLIIHEHAIDTLAFPTSTKVSVKQWLAFTNYKRCTDFQITPESLRAIVCDEDQSIFATLAASHVDG